MIHEVHGDILLSRAQVIAHGVAPNDDFHHGLALSLRERWPAMYKDFRHFCHTAHPKPGTLWTWGGPDHLRVVSLFTQEVAAAHGGKPGRATTAHVNHCLRELHRLIETEKFASVALPRLATGIGGLGWEEVEPLVRQHLGALKVPVFLYTRFEAGKTAQEPTRG
ncbi:MAG: macro domain-containing protein [Planctomycetota bacterium]